MRALWLAVAAGCEGGSASSDSSPFETQPPQTTLPTGVALNGTLPEENLAPPEFSSVTNRDGSPRVQADLVGQPTVLWFYPFANSGG